MNKEHNKKIEISNKNAEISYQSIKFKNHENYVRGILYKLFYFDIPKDELEKIGKLKIANNKIIFENIQQQKADRKFDVILSKHITNLKNSLGNKNSMFIHENSGIPLIGNGSFGIVDRGSNIIEIKPITGCNLDCIYCSVDETKRAIDFLVEPNYLVQELEKIINIKESQDIEIHIGCQGEPLLYEPLEELIQLCSKIKKVKRISMDTNACMITKEKADSLIKAGLTQFNISIDTLNFDKAKQIASAPYNINKIKEITEYISKKSDLMVAPILVPKINDEDMIELIKWIKQLKDNSNYNIRIGIQKYLKYKFGKKPIKEETWDSFFETLKKYENEYKIKLIFDASDFKVVKDIMPKKPFKKNDIIKAEIVCQGRMDNEVIAVSENRCISVINSTKKTGLVKVKILRDKHNIFFGTEA
jgi:uncharacterized Fe-S cluster-containing radical SAM superfamily enzyme